jgi:hypothetical protein
MKFSKKNKIIFFSLLILLNLVLRYPISHAYGADGFFIYSLANSISNEGYAKWVIHPLSLVGTYPLSYASMYPFLLSGLSQSADISIEHNILISGVILSIFGTLSAYFVAKEIKDDDFFSFIVAFMFSLSPVFFFYTNWIGSERGIFISLFPIFIYTLIKAVKSKKNIIMSCMFLLLLATTHRLFYFIPLIIIAYISALLITKYSYIVTFNFKDPYLHRFLLILIPVILLFCIQSSDFSESYSEGLLTGDIHQSNILLLSIINLFVNFLGKIGLSLLFVLIGFIYIVTNKDLTFNKVFLITSLMYLTPTLQFRYYVSLIYLIFLSILVGYGIIASISKIKQYKKSFSSIFIVVLLVSSVIFSMYMDNRWKEMPTNNAMKDETYDTGIFLRNRADTTIITNDGWTGQQISAVSGKPVLPFGIQQWYSPLQLVYDFEDRSNLTSSAKLLPLKDMLPPPDVWYTYGNISNTKENYQSIMYNDISSKNANENIAKYNVEYVLLNKDMENTFVSYGVRNSQFIPSVTEGENKILDSKTISIWHLTT